MHQCLNVLEICADPEPIHETDEFLPLVQQQIVQDHMWPVIRSIRPAAAATENDVNIVADPVVAKSVNNVHTFCGLYGCQMMSFLVQVISCYDGYMMMVIMMMMLTMMMIITAMLAVSCVHQAPTSRISQTLQTAFADLNLGRTSRHSVAVPIPHVRQLQL